MENKKTNQTFFRINNKSKTNINEKARNSVILGLKKGNFDVIKEKIKEQNESKDDNNNPYKNNSKNKTRRSIANARPLKKLILSNASLNKEYILNILEKNPKNRKENEIKNVADFLSTNYTYFQNLKKSDSQLMVEKLAKLSKIKIFYPGETIIKFGDIGDKFYVVIEGFVQVYKPIFEEKKMTPNDFIKYMNDIKFREKDENKYLRIKDYNKTRNFDISEYEKMDSEMNFMKIKREFFVENLQSMGIYGEGFSFGEISLMTNAKRNATIKCSDENNNKHAILLSIGKESYDKAFKEYQEKKLTKDIESFIKAYPFFKDFTRENMIAVFNCITKINLEKGDYLFHQNDPDTNLYFVVSGKLEVYSHISLNWINQFMEYIINMRDNVLGHLYVKRPKKLADTISIINTIQKLKLKSPMIFKEVDLWEKIDRRVNENNLIGLKYDEEKINDYKNIYKIKIQNVEKPELLGIESSFEFKNKFYTARCISENAEIKYIKIVDLVKIISNLRLRELNYLIDFVLEKKNIFAKQIISSMKTIEYKIISNLEMKYEHFLKFGGKNMKEEEKNEDKEYNNNKTLSVIKVKGYKSGINDILDDETNLLEKKPTDIIKSYLFRHKEPSRSAIKLSKKQELIDFVFSNKTKKIKREKDIFKNNKENLLILKKLMRNNNDGIKHLKKFTTTKSNISGFLLNNSISNISFYKPVSINNSNKNDFSISNSLNDNKFTNSFLINSNYIYKNKKHSNINNENMKNKIPSNYLTFINTKINYKSNNSSFIKNTNNLDDKSKSKIKSALMRQKIYKDLSKTNSLVSHKKQKINKNDLINNKDKSNNNTSFLNISGINSNRLQKLKREEKEKMSKTSRIGDNQNNVFGSVDKNKKEFYLSVGFSQKIVNINKQKDEKLLNHHFPIIKK